MAENTDNMLDDLVRIYGNLTRENQRLVYIVALELDKEVSR